MKQLFYMAWRAMGCEVSAQLETEGDGDAVLRALPGQVETIEAQLSRFRPESDLMRLNAQAGHWVSVSQVLFDNIITAKHAARLTDGLFNPLVLPALIANGYRRNFADIGQPVYTAPRPAAGWNRIELRPRTREVRIPADSALDLGGIAKGWTAALIVEQLKAYGACLVNMGGDLVGWGAPQNQEGWQIQIDDPFSQNTLVTLSLVDASIVTTGIDFRRWSTTDGASHHHIIDPRTGNSAETDIISVTVYHPHAPTAEAYAKAVLLRGAESGLHWLQTQWNAAGLVVQRDGAVLTTPNFVHLMVERINQ